jgi:hypothetical protein
MTSASDVLRPTPRIRPERLAWGVLLISFVIFCIICAGSTLGVYYFFFQSTVPMPTLLLVGRGTVTLTTNSDPIGRSVRGGDGLPTYLSNSTDISTDLQSQGTISFRDDDASGRLIAAVTLKRNASLSIRATSLPRFDWSSSPIAIDLYDFSGEADVFVPENLGRDLVLSIETTPGSRVSVAKSGSYTVSATDTRLSVNNRNGQAVLFEADPHINRDIPAGMQGVAKIDQSQINISPAYTDLLGNSTFEDVNTDSSGNASQLMTTRWGCTIEGELPRSSYSPQVVDGRLALRLLRDDNASTHGQTTCLQAFPGQNGLDVSQYSYLALRATFLINYQSLTACGIAGSECPLMLRLDYLDALGRPQIWYHGFYARVDSGANYPTRCSSCTQEHENIYEKAWYTYDSGNLIDLFPADFKPASIQVVRFYASGHEYDVYVSEVALLAGQVPGGS